MIKCKSCNADNIDEARYCRKCGKIIEKASGPTQQPQFEQKAENIINLYPDYGFQPVSLVKIPVKFGVFKWRIISFLLGIFFFVIGINTGVVPLGFMGLGFLALFLILILCIKTKPLKQEIAEYIQKKGSPIRFIVKDGKFGLYDVKKHKIAVQPEYDNLRCKQGEKFIYLALKEGKQFEIDVNGNVLK